MQSRLCLLKSVLVGNGNLMFDYSSPAGTSLLSDSGALLIYRQFLESENISGAAASSSLFESLEAFSRIAPSKVSSPRQDWTAYPLSKSASSDISIDQNRKSLQDEYVEWRVERNNMKVTRITFTTQFVEYFIALAAVGMDKLVAGVKESEPNATPTAQDLFGIADVNNIDSLSPTQRANTYFSHSFASNANPWNNGEKGILHLSQPANTLGALYGLLVPCAEPRPTIPLANICRGGFCAPGRNSDPKICATAQTQARNNRVLTLADPVGIEILDLSGDWEVDGTTVDINDSEFWTVSLGGRRAVLEVPEGLTLDGDEIETGTQVSRFLEVGASLNVADANDLPTGMRMNFGAPRTV